MAEYILLTIAVPTYNGARTIVRALSSILPQLTPQVELLVCDNASTDGTDALVLDLVTTNPQIRYYCNEVNVGFDRNINLCFQRAKGDFVWIIADDDIICHEGGVDKVLKTICAHPDLAVIFADSRHPIRLDPADTGVCRDGAEFFQKSRFKCGLVSSNIFRRSVWKTVNIDRYFGSGWIHMGFLVETLCRSHSYVICEELIAQLVLEDGHGAMRWGGTGSFLRTGLNLVRIYKTMPSFGYDPATVKAAYLTIKGGYRHNIPLAKAKGLRVDLGLIREFAELYYRFPSFWLLDLPLLLIPGFLFRWARALLHAVQPAAGNHEH